MAAGTDADGFAAVALVLIAALLFKLELAGAFLAGLKGVVGGIGAAVILRRVSDRRFIVQRLAENNARQRQLLIALPGAGMAHASGSAFCHTPVGPHSFGWQHP